jgi:hypothetical protein
MTTTASAPATGKVRRRALGGKPARGRDLQREGRRIRRADVRRIRVGAPDPRVSGVAGLVGFNAFTQELGLGRELARHFAHLKRGRRVVYPMAAQMQLFVDAAIAGAQRVFGLEELAADPVFRHLAGGSVPSIDTVYRDLARLRADELEALEELMASHAAPIARARGLAALDEEFVDIDTTVTVVFGEKQEALPGPNPRYRGRRSYHPILARAAKTDAIIGARLRPGDTGLGEADVEDVKQWIARARAALGPKTILTARIDAGGDCAALLNAIDEAAAFFIVKAKRTAALLGMIASDATRWTTIDRDADGKPSRQVAEIDFRREDWPTEDEKRYRVIAVRTNERLSGDQVCLWPDLDLSVSVYITNDRFRSADDIARAYDDRAGIEPIIGDLKNGFGIGKHSSTLFEANEAAFLLKLLAYNLLRRYVCEHHPKVRDWRTPWLRRLLIAVPGRLLRAEGRWQLRMAPRPKLE